MDLIGRPDGWELWRKPEWIASLPEDERRRVEAMSAEESSELFSEWRAIGVGKILDEYSRLRAEGKYRSAPNKGIGGYCDHLVIVSPGSYAVGAFGPNRLGAPNPMAAPMLGGPRPMGPGGPRPGGPGGFFGGPSGPF